MARAPRVAILGAGASGIGLAIRLRQAGFSDFTLYEKESRLGGTWRDNTYPGSGCDVPSHFYSFSFARNPRWSRKFAEQPEILGYFEHLADTHGLHRHIRFGSEIVSAEWDDTTREWHLQLADGEHVTADVFVAAAGQLNRPHTPDLPGLENFRGTTFHSARWDHDHDLTGERVAVVGNGASAVQFVPRIAEQVAHLTIFQRSANYIVPKPDRAFRPWEKLLFRRVPVVEQLYRWSIYWRLEARFVAFRRGNRLGELMRRKFHEGVQPMVSARLPEPSVMPDYPVGCKRILISDDYLPTLLQPNVEVVLDPIERLTADAVVTADGSERAFDTVIFATGFETTTFLGPVRVSGVDGAKLHDVWRDGAEAYLGLAVPGFPNFFMLYGPNTNLGHNSILFMVEQQINHIVELLSHMVEHDAAAVDVRVDAMRRFNRDVDEKMADTVWAAGCHSWYKTESGRVTNNWPSFTVAYWKDTRHPVLSDYVRRH